MPVNNTIQFRKGLGSEWTSTNPVLSSGEPGYDLTNGILKIGDGINTWTDLPSPAASEIHVYAKNTTTGTLSKGQAVYINGALGDNPTLQLAIATGDNTSSKTLGLLKQNLAVNEFGYVLSEGILEGIDTNGANAGDPIWLSPTTSGGLLYGSANKPYAPSHLVFLGYVLRKQLNNGRIYVKVQNGYELEELHNVAVTGATNGQFLQYNSSSGLWVSSSSGNFSTLQVNGTGVSLSGHTHTSSQITDFNSSVSGLLLVKNIVAGTGISVSSVSGSYTINNTVSAGSASAEDIMDVIGTGLIAGTGISVVYNDNSGTITVSLAATTITGYEILTTTKDTFTVTPNYLIGNLNVYYNGFKLLNGEDYTATNGSTFVLSSPGASGDVVEWIGLGEPGQYASLNHTHNISDITNFSSGVSGLVSGIYAPLSGKLNQFASTSSSDLASVISDETGSGLLVFNNSPSFTGLLSATSGNFTQNLQLNGTGVSISGHTHTASNITDFNSSVSGLLPVTSIVAGSGISVSSLSGTYTINAKVYSTTIGDGSTTSYTVTHNLSVSNDVQVTVRDTGTNYYVYPDIKYVNSNSVLIEFTSAPTSNQYRVSIIGF